MKLCDYGCGREPNYYFPAADKWCCESHYSKCTKVREHQSKKMKEVQNRSEVKMKKSESTKKIWNDLEIRNRYIEAMNQSEVREKRINNMDRPEVRTKHLEAMNQTKTKAKLSKKMKEKWEDLEYKENQIKSHTFTIKKIKEKYKTFAKEEEMRYSSNGEIQVHCKYNKCKKSKDGGGWFTPTKNQFDQRRRALEDKNGNDGGYFYCLDESCKHECCLYNLQSDPSRLNEYEKYNDKVWKLTNKTVKKFFDKIKNIELRGIKYGYALDHKYSIYDGFENNVDPKIIAHYKNLQIMSIPENSKKNKKSSINLEELKNQIKEYSIECKEKKHANS